MKNIAAMVFGCFVLVFTACSKNSNLSANNSIVGAWALTQAYGGQLGYDSTFSPNGENMLEISTKSFVKIVNKKIIDSGSYQLQINSNKISFNGINGQSQSTYEISNDTLYIDREAPAYDGLAYIYTRIYFTD